MAAKGTAASCSFHSCHSHSCRRHNIRPSGKEKKKLFLSDQVQDLFFPYLIPLTVWNSVLNQITAEHINKSKLQKRTLHTSLALYVYRTFPFTTNQSRFHLRDLQTRRYPLMSDPSSLAWTYTNTNNVRTCLDQLTEWHSSVFISGR